MPATPVIRAARNLGGVGAGSFASSTLCEDHLEQRLAIVRARHLWRSPIEALASASGQGIAKRRESGSVQANCREASDLCRSACRRKGDTVCHMGSARSCESMRAAVQSVIRATYRRQRL